MKTILVLSMVFCAIALPALGELTDADLDKIRLIVKEEVKTEITGVRQEIAGLRQELKAEITGVEQELKAEIAGVKQELKAEIASSEKNIKNYIDAKIEGVDKRLSTYNWVISVLMPLIVAAVGIPTAIMAWRSGRDRSLERRVETLTKETETLTKEIEMLKEQRIVNP